MQMVMHQPSQSLWEETCHGRSYQCTLKKQKRLMAQCTPSNFQWTINGGLTRKRKGINAHSQGCSHKDMASRIKANILRWLRMGCWRPYTPHGMSVCECACVCVCVLGKKGWIHKEGEEMDESGRADTNHACNQVMNPTMCINIYWLSWALYGVPCEKKKKRQWLRTIHPQYHISSANRRGIAHHGGHSRLTQPQSLQRGESNKAQKDDIL